jgi:hypothetical protein
MKQNSPSSAIQVTRETRQQPTDALACSLTDDCEACQ